MCRGSKKQPVLNLRHFQNLLISHFFLVPTYWEYKYRNITEYPDLISFEERNKDYERSDLQKFWPSYLSIASMIPNVLFLKLNAIFGHRFRSQPRLLTAMIIIIGEFEILIQYHFLIFFKDSLNIIFQGYLYFLMPWLK